MWTLNTEFLEFELDKDGGGFWFFIGDRWDGATGKIEREELVQLKTMIEEALNGSNTTNQ